MQHCTPIKYMTKCSVCNKELDNTITHVVIENKNKMCICEDCVKSLNRTLEFPKKTKDSPFELKKPLDIYNEINMKVIGQEKAKKILSVAIYNHYKRVMNKDLSIEKTNILLAGPSGSGKTFLAKTIAEILQVPFVICDATRLTETGYIGDDVDSCISTLYENSGGDIEKTEIGIIYIDEIDKIAKKEKSPSSTRDIGGESVQNALLKLMEGTTVRIQESKERRMINQSSIVIDTSNILFICGGAFSGIREQEESKSIGFFRTENEAQKKTSLSVNDFIEYGMTRELMGRLPVIAELNELTKNDLIEILKNPVVSPIRNYKNLLILDDVELYFSDEALEEIAEYSIRKDLGARGLKAIIEEIMLDIMFEIPSKEEVNTCGITKEIVQEKLFKNDLKTKKNYG